MSVHDRDDAVAYLVGRQAALLEHSGATLLAHLLGTRGILESWGTRECVCLAGLFHSVYGTPSFDGLIGLEARPEVRRVIGDQAEALAYLFGAMTRATLLPNVGREGPPYVHDRLTGKWVFITREQVADLCHITAANWLEQVPRVAEVRDVTPGPFLRMAPLLLPRAWHEVEQALRSPSRRCGH
jgi:hypothetical protein